MVCPLLTHMCVVCCCVHTGITLNVPGVPFAVPLHVAQAIAAEMIDTGLMGISTVDRRFVHGVGAAASTAAGGSTASQPQPQVQRSSYVRRGPVDEVSRQAAMSTGISPAAAGVGVVPDLTQHLRLANGMAASAAARVHPVAQQQLHLQGWRHWHQRQPKLFQHWAQSAA